MNGPETMNDIVLTAPDDFHVHLRDGEILHSVVGYTSSVFRRALVMPNLTPPVRSGHDVASYRQRILDAHGNQNVPFTPLMTFKVMPGMSPSEVATCLAAGAVGGKLYPQGVTTNSSDGVSDIEASYPVFEELESRGAVLCLHGETPGVFCMDQEKAFLKDLKGIVQAFPRLRVVLEHVTTADAVRAVLEGPETLSATVTVHHLMTTLDDVVGGFLKPHNFCKPIPKRPEDRSAIQDAVFGGSPKFFLGTDSAPHFVGTKECSSGCAGVFSAPCAMEILLELFEEKGVNESILESFTSFNGAAFYGLPRNEDKVRFVRLPCNVPNDVPVWDMSQDMGIFPRKRRSGTIIPFRAGCGLRWSRGL